MNPSPPGYTVRPATMDGFGRTMELFHAYAERGVVDVALDVDASNATGAVALYERVGMRMTRRDDSYERVLPPLA